MFLWGGLVLTTPVAGHPSERSERLVAQGELAYQTGRFAEARDRFAEAAAADPNDASAQYGIGLALGKLHRWEEARAAFERAVTLRPGFTAAQRALGLVSYHLGEAALERKEHEHAVELLDQAARLAPAIASRARYLAGVARLGAGQAGQARTDFEAAARAPERDIAVAATAYLERLAAGAPTAPAKRWELRGATGIQYDSNPALEPHGSHAHRDQAAFLLAAGGRYDVVQRERALLRLDYDFYQTLYPDFQDFDFRAHRLSGTASFGLRRWLWAGVQGGYNHYSLGPRAYLQEPFVLPFLSLAEGQLGWTQLLFRHGEPDYLSRPFKSLRDGRTNAAGVSQRLLFAGGARYVTLGYEFGDENPRSPAGNDFERNSNGGHVGVGFPAWFGTAVELTYLYRNDDYARRNSFSGLRKKRDDDEHRFYAGVKRDLSAHLNVTLAYYGTANISNIGLFDYRRSIVSLLLEATR
jgi:tetratricopeptide (TPR) repeat protein